MQLTEQLVALQGDDSTIDQLTNRRARLPERTALAAAAEAQRALRKRIATIESRQAELAKAVAEAEDAAQGLTRSRDRLQAQLKTVIAPREAEALMAELATIATRREALDDAELEHLDEEERLGTDLADARRSEPDVDAAVRSAEGELAAAEAVIDAEVAAVTTHRGELAAGIAASALADYEQRRKHFGGVAIATLNGRTCSGCHMDLSTSEFDRVRKVAADAIAECPQCGRILVP